MESLQPYLDKVFFGNSVMQYVISIGLFAATIVGLVLIEKILLSRLRTHAEKSSTKVDDFILRVIDKMLLPIFYLAGFYVGTKQLNLSESLDKLIHIIWIAGLTIQLVRLALAILIHVVDVASNTRGRSAASKGLATIVNVMVWGVGLVFLLDNMGFDISAVVAGLGIGGIAIALAAQNILGDLFNYFVIFFDKPFQGGDFLIVGDYMGVVEHVGIKTTRIRSLGGEQIIISNSDLTSTRIRNYKRMAERRILFKIGVIYQTTSDQVKKIPAVIKNTIDSIEGTRFDRAHFQAFGSFSLDFEIVYYVLSADYNQYMNIQQEINFKLKEAFEREGIEFAYPSQTLFLEPGAKPVELKR